MINMVGFNISQETKAEPEFLYSGFCNTDFINQPTVTKSDDNRSLIPTNGGSEQKLRPSPSFCLFLFFYHPPFIFSSDLFSLYRNMNIWGGIRK